MYPPRGITGRGSAYSRVIVDELNAAKHKAFPRPHGDVLFIYLVEVGYEDI